MDRIIVHADVNYIGYNFFQASSESEVTNYKLKYIACEQSSRPLN